MNPCCERDHDGDGNCDHHPFGLAVYEEQLSRSAFSKQYLGDAVYVVFDGYSIVLTTENGIHATNTIAFEPEVTEAFFRYVERLRKLLVELKSLKKETPGKSDE